MYLVLVKVRPKDSPVSWKSEIDESDYATPTIPSLSTALRGFGWAHRNGSALHGVTSPLSRLCGVKLQLDYWLLPTSIERDGH